MDIMRAARSPAAGVSMAGHYAVVAPVEASTLGAEAEGSTAEAVLAVTDGKIESVFITQ